MSTPPFESDFRKSYEITGNNTMYTINNLHDKETVGSFINSKHQQIERYRTTVSVAKARKLNKEHKYSRKL